jgi:hypothetical protein
MSNQLKLPLAAPGRKTEGKATTSLTGAAASRPAPRQSNDEAQPLPAPPLPKSKRTPEQEWLAWAAEEWAAAQGANMTVRWARDVTLIRPLLGLHGEEELKRRWKGFVRTMDEYFARRGWDIPSFSTAVDRYRGDVDIVPIVRRRQLIQAEVNDRDPLTGASLRYRGRQ